ncbi:FabD/lysophospholipase-like protein [Favolaschia claudopus]|uniref:FabD/lysophospholipase-like protein n=1 Tax=Favolaschia claudopus TaxID=2862362 RepID=A0AAV9ZJU3_9AGAR
MQEARLKSPKVCPEPVPKFTGRRGILQEIHQFYTRQSGSRLVYVLHGLGGAGKSQLAFKFAQEAQENNRFSDIFYVDASSQQTAEDDLKLLAPAGSEETANSGLGWLARQKEWLLVFDNADDIQLDISKFFPRGKGNILITTRNPQLSMHGEDFKVSDMDVDDAKDLLLKLVGKKAVDNNKEQLATDIVMELHCFALAVTQPGGYIHARGKLDTYLNLYKTSRDALLNQKEVQGQDQYGFAVYATWALSYKLPSPGGKCLLQICSQLHHQNIPQEIFENASLSNTKLEDPELQIEVAALLAHIGGQNKGWDQMVFDKCAGELQSFSLIGQNLLDNSYSIHPLVQHWSNETTSQIHAQLESLKMCVLAIIGLSISKGNTMEEHQYRHKLVAIDTYVGDTLAFVLYEGGQFKNAIKLQVVVMEARKQHLGEDHSDTLHSMDTLAMSYWRQGQWSDAEDLVVFVLEARKRKLSPSTLYSMNYLASIYLSQGRWHDALALQVVVLAAFKQRLGVEHPDTLSTMNNLAATYNSQHQWKDAEDLQIFVLETRKKQLGENHPETLAITNNLAATYSSQGKHSDAETLKLVVLEAYKRQLGKEHPNTLTIMNNLALNYQNQEQWTDAEPLQLAVLEGWKRQVGAEHPLTLTIMNNLAATYHGLGQWKDAEALQVTVLEARKQHLGGEHPDTLVSMNNLARTYLSQHRFGEAEALEVKVVETYKQLLGEEHPETQISMQSLSRIQQEEKIMSDVDPFLKAGSGKAGGHFRESPSTPGMFFFGDWDYASLP